MTSGSAYLGETSFGQSSKSCGDEGLRAHVRVLPQLCAGSISSPLSLRTGKTWGSRSESCGGNALNPVFLAFPHLCSLLLERKAREGGRCQGKACCLPGDRGIIQLQ